MPKPLTAAGWGRWCEQSTTPLLVVDEESRVLWLNAAAVAWCGVESDKLLGQLLPFAGPLTDTAIPSGPDPRVWQGLSSPAVVKAADGRLGRIEWSPLADETSAMTVALGRIAVDSADESSATGWPTAIDWADELRTWQLRADQTPLGRLLVGQSAERRLARQRAEWAAKHRLPVWIQGPIGAGRRTTAEAIHYAAGDPTAPLLILAARGLTLETLNARLLAWTRVGRSGAGSLIVTDVLHATADIAARLAEIAADTKAPRLLLTSGGAVSDWERQTPLDAEFSAALTAGTIALPPLAAVRQDLPLVIQTIIENANRRSGKQLRGCRTDALELLCCYDWPRETAELAVALETARDQATGPELTPADLPEYLSQAVAARLYPTKREERISLPALLAEYETGILQAALTATRGNKTAAAANVGLSRTRFLRRCNELGITVESPATVAKPRPTKPTAAPPENRPSPDFIPDLPFIEEEQS